MKKVLSTLSGEKNCSTDLKYLQAKYAIHEGNLDELKIGCEMAAIFSKSNMVENIKTVEGVIDKKNLNDKIWKALKSYFEYCQPSGEPIRRP